MKIRSILENDRKLIITLYVLALAFRLGIIVLAAWNRGLHFENAQIAQYIISGQGYIWDWYKTIPPQPTAILPPIYTYFIAFFMAVFAEPSRWIYLAQALLNSLGVIPSFYLGKLLWDRKTGAVLAALFAFFPEMAYMPTKMISEPLVIPLIITMFFVYFRYKQFSYDSSYLKHFFLFGALCGLAVLVKTSVSFIILSFGLCILFAKNFKINRIKSLILMAIGVIIVISPWSVRNTIVFDKFVPIRTMYGFNLWRGNHPGATGTPRFDTKTTIENAMDPVYRKYIETSHPYTELELDQFYYDEAVKFIKENPGEFIKLTFKRILYYIFFDPTHPLTMNPVYLGGHLFLLVFGIWGAILLKKRRELDSIFLVVPLVALFFYAPVVMLPRYRLFFTIALLFLSSIPISRVLLKNPRFNFLERKSNQDT